MRFNEKAFRQLADETEKKVIELGTTAPEVLRKHQKITEQLVQYLASIDTPFERERCLIWVDGMKHDPPSTMSASYMYWIALRRFVILLAEQDAGTLSEWKHYSSVKTEEPKSSDFQAVLGDYRTYLLNTGLCSTTVRSCVSVVRVLLIHLEENGVDEIAKVQNYHIAKYFTTERFANRKPRGIQTEACNLRKFLAFLENNRYTTCTSLHCAVPRARVRIERIVTVLTPEMEADILADKQDSLVDLRDKAVCLLALHTGLRSCDIRNLKFRDINWENGLLTIQQQKTGVDLLHPLDNETQNAIVDYVLNERPVCECDFIFVTAVGPAQKIARHDFRIKYRAQGKPSYDSIPHDGLHIYRRTYASRLLQCGTPLPLISEMLGHIGKDSVQCYLSTDEAKMKRCSLDLSLLPYQGRDY